MRRPDLVGKQKGLTLVELMISVALSLLLLAGVMVLFAGNKTSHRMQEGLSTVQETGRYALTVMKNDFIKSGYGGCTSDVLKPVVIASSPLPFVNDYASGKLVEGEDNVSGRTIEGVTLANNTDFVTIRGPLSSPLFYVANAIHLPTPLSVQGDASALAVGDFLLITDCAHTEIFKPTAITVSATSPPTTTIAHAGSQNIRGGIFQSKFGAEATVTRLATHTYFVAPSSWTNSSGATVQSLYRANGDGSPDELLQGVEDMQITYGVDANGDGTVDSFYDASGVTDWTEVASVRVSLLVNSVEDASDTLAQYVYSPTGSTSVTPSNSADRLIRQEFTAVLTSRNSLL